MRRENKDFWIVYSILAILILIRLLPFAFRDARMWGFNHLIFLPGIYTIFYIILAAIALALPFLPFAREWGEKFVNWFSQTFFESSRKYINRLIFIAVMGALFVLFPMPTHFLGDGYTVLANLASLSGTFVKWSEKGITLVLMGIQFLLGPKNQHTALWAFRLVSILSGIISIWFFFLTAGIIGEDRLKKYLAFAALFFSGALLLFFGYVENYPAIWVALSGFVYFGLRYLKARKGIIWALVFLALGIFIHLEMGIFIPALIFLIFSQGRGRKLYERFKVIIWLIVSLCAVAGIIIFVRKYNTDLFFENMFLPFLQGKPIFPPYALISIPHFADMVSLLMLLSPLFLLFIYLAARNVPGRLRSKEGRFLAIEAIFTLIFVTIIDPMLGLPRDWDLFSIAAFALTLLLVINISRETIGSIGRVIISLTIYLLIAILPYLLIELQTDPSIAYAKYNIDLNLSKSFPAYSVLMDYYENKNDTLQAEIVHNLYQPQFVNETKMYNAESALAGQSIRKAEEIIDSIPPDKFSWRYHNLLSSLYAATGDLHKSLEESDEALQLNQYSCELFLNRAKLMNMLKENNEALKYLDMAYQLDNRDPDVLEGLTTLNAFGRRQDQIIRYAYEWIAADSTAYKAYYYLTGTLIMSRQLDKAESTYEKYLKYGTADTLLVARKAELSNLIGKLENK